MHPYPNSSKLNKPEKARKQIYSTQQNTAEAVDDQVVGASMQLLLGSNHIYLRAKVNNTTGCCL